MRGNVSIAGGSGFVAGELLRLLESHPGATVVSVLSETQEGQTLGQVHDGLDTLASLRFTSRIAEETELVFLCLPHGAAAGFLQSRELPGHCRVIDLSRDHRVRAGEWIYGLPELARAEIRRAHEDGRHIANPGCFATAIQLGLLPLLRSGALTGDVHTSAITGSTGAGRAALPTLQHAWRHDNAQVYQAFTHPHLEEIRATMRRVLPVFDGRHFFIPYRGSFTRGIIATSYAACDLTTDALRALYRETYASHPFVTVVDGEPALKQVINTNQCMIGVRAIDGMCVVVTVIDNLLKGAAGQAVQNMNLLFGLDERAGLRLKASVY